MTTESSPDRSRRALLLLGASAALAACGADVEGADVDASTTGDAPREAGLGDAARTDVAVRDDGPLDAARPDASAPDASAMDAARPDVSLPDAAAMDVARPDAAVADASRPDVPVDAGPVDTGVPCTPPSTATRIGPIASFAVGRWVAVTAQAIIVGRDARGIFAYTNVCTHRSCAVPAPASAAATSRCPCHGATFTSEGAVVSGPTSTPLRNYPVYVCGGNVYVDKTRSVAMGTRTPVP
ncbi:MAG: Rieske (2Fe-2S) protein [Polyangiales bacterium]